jgi:4-methyl-5(b-hydroxyethyl)-thiazole monophosphate biosynthesis
MSSALVPLADGFEEIEAITIVDIMRRGGIEVTLAGLIDKLVVGSHQIPVMADCLLEEVVETIFDMVVLPGGPGTKNLQSDYRIIKIVQQHYHQDRYVGAICAAPLVLMKAGILQNKKVTGYPTIVPELVGLEYVSAEVVVDGRVITGQAPAAAVPFALKLVELLQCRDTANEVARAMVSTGQFR